MNTAIASWRSITFGVLEDRGERYPASRQISRFIVALIMANGLAVVLESNARLYADYREFFVAFEVFSVSVFTIEYLARLWAATEHPRYSGTAPWLARFTYALRPMSLVDLLAVLPFYLSLFIQIDLRYLRLFRLLRLLKLSQHFHGLDVFGTVLRREAGAIVGALIIMMIITVVSACLMFTVENSAAAGAAQFDSVAQAIWWAVVTLTTVGYGDITPVTYAGKLLGMAIMVLGVGTMALPAGIMAARFSEELQRRREEMAGELQHALADGVLDAEELEELRKLQARLGMSDEDLERMINLQRGTLTSFRYCPHCGESLSAHR